MRKIKLILPQEGVYPSFSANSNQIIHQSVSFAHQGVETILLIQKNFRRPPQNFSPTLPSLSRFYDVNLEEKNLKIILFPDHKGIAGVLKRFFSLVEVLKTKKGVFSVIYTRRPEYAQFFLKLRKYPGKKRWLVVMEFHRWREVEKFKNVLAQCDGLVVISESFRKHLTEKEKIKVPLLVAHDGVEPEKFKTFSPPLKNKPPWFLLYTGSLKPSKGVETLLKSLILLPEEVKLKIVGGDKKSEDFKRIVRLKKNLNLGKRVEILEYVPPGEVKKFFFLADILILPSTREESEGSPLKLFEYMAAGKPLIASSLPSIKEILEKGKDALFFPPGDEKSLAYTVQKILKDPSLGKKLVENAREKVKEFTWERRAKRILSFIESLLPPEDSPSIKNNP